MRRHLVLVVSAVVAVGRWVGGHRRARGEHVERVHGAPWAGRRAFRWLRVLLGLFARVTAGRVELRRGAEFSRRLWSSAVSYFPAPPPRERPDTTAQA
jgi:hypothetical protein